MIALFLKEVPLPPTGSVVSGYAPINAEIDVFPLLKALLKKGYRCALPSVQDADARLDFLSWDEDMPMQTTIYGINEPDSAISEVLTPNLLIVPMLAFDARGGRIGYGSGNFDRTFAYLNKIGSFAAVGVAYDSQRVERVPMGPYDYPMDMIVTDKQVYKVRSLP